MGCDYYIDTIIYFTLVSGEEHTVRISSQHGYFNFTDSEVLNFESNDAYRKHILESNYEKIQLMENKMWLIRNKDLQKEYLNYLLVDLNETNICDIVKIKCAYERM